MLKILIADKVAFYGGNIINAMMIDWFKQMIGWLVVCVVLIEMFPQRERERMEEPPLSWVWACCQVVKMVHIHNTRI